MSTFPIRFSIKALELSNISISTDKYYHAYKINPLKDENKNDKDQSNKE